MTGMSWDRMKDAGSWKKGLAILEFSDITRWLNTERRLS
jgi:hypothetical protein